MKSSSYQLSQRVSFYVRELEALYRNRPEKKILHEIITSCAVYVKEAVYENYHNNHNGLLIIEHAIFLFVDENIFLKINDAEEQKITDQLCCDFRARIRWLPEEDICCVALALVDEDNSEYQAALRPFSQPVIDPDTPLDIWKPGHIRLFISHRDKYKSEVSKLAKLLENYGISSFVAHDNILPMEEWQTTIEKAMQTMEILVAFITNDFFESTWTNQEVGFAIGHGIPVVSVKLEEKVPEGFLSPVQAIRANVNDLNSICDVLYETLCKHLGHNKKERLRKAIIQAFTISSNEDEIKVRFAYLDKLLDTLTEVESKKIRDAYKSNINLCRSSYLDEYNKLIDLFNRKTGKQHGINSPQKTIDELKCI